MTNKQENLQKNMLNDLSIHNIIYMKNLSAQNRIQKEYGELLIDPPPGIQCEPVDDNDIYHWFAIITGPQDSPYEGGYFYLDITFP